MDSHFRRYGASVVAVAAVLAMAGCSAAAGGSGSGAAPASESARPSEEPISSVSAPPAEATAPVYKATIDRLNEQRVAKPARLAVDDVDIDMDVTGVGVLDNGDLDIPERAAVAGWWRAGAAPGEEDGVALIAAHVDDADAGLGPFAALKDVKEGALIDVELDDGSTVSYQVSAIEQTSKQTVDFPRILNGSIGHHLVLVTCGGEFNWDTRHYDDNVIVWAERADA